MAERIVSAGVFTREIDQSFLPAAIGQIGAAIVGPTLKGPAYVPTQVSSFSEYQKIFGSYTTDSYVPFAVEEYLKNGSVITVTRLLYENGYAIQNGALAIIASSGSGAAQVKAVTHVLHPTVAVLGSGSAVDANYFEQSIITNGTSGSFNITVSGSFSTLTVPGFEAFTVGNNTAVSASIIQTDNNYITKVFPTKPTDLRSTVYVQYENPNVSSLFANLANVTVEIAKISDYSFEDDSKVAETPKITSQKIGSLTRDLFRFATISHGTAANTEIKVAISNLKTASESADPDGYGKFDVEVRRVNTVNINNTPNSSNDTDAQPDLIETFRGVNLNPLSPDFIGIKIGDRYQTVSDDGTITFNGDYPNKSAYIRVILEPGVINATNDKSLIPFGFRALNSPIPMASGSINLRPVSFKTSQVVSNQYSPNNYLGFDFTAVNNLNYLAPVPSSGSTTGSNSDFYLGDVSQNSQAAFPTLANPYTGTLQTALVAGTFTTNIKSDTRKFIIPMQGGFDGARPNLPKYSGADITATNTFGFDCSTSAATGTIAYNKAFSILANTDYYDMNMLLTPGIIDRLHSSVAIAARNLCVNRQDTFYVMDSNALNDSLSDVVTQVTAIDNNYTATYWPWLKIKNSNTGAQFWVPPSVLVGGAISRNDVLSAPWYAPAGLNRGGLPVIMARTQLSPANRNSLYEARVNPIASFPNDGVVIWGQKTLQARPSALDRVNVRRLLIAVKKFIASATRYLVFDQNTDSTREKFLNIANPYLSSVKQNQGLYEFRVIMDASNNTPDLIDQNILYGQLFLQPTRTAEFIILDFNIQPTGAAFPE